MANITITLNTDNEAFTENESNEVSRILKHLAEGFRCVDYSINELEGRRLSDINGNTVGRVRVIE